jgi:hypothetical protein
MPNYMNTLTVFDCHAETKQIGDPGFALAVLAQKVERGLPLRAVRHAMKELYKGQRP